jgi:hypothetical protein
MCPNGWFKPRHGWIEWKIPPTSPDVATTASHTSEAAPEPTTPNVAPSADEQPAIGPDGRPQRETIGGHDVIGATKHIELPESGSFLVLEDPRFLDPSMAYLAGDGFRLSPLSILGLPPQSKGPFDLDTIKLMRARYLLQKGLLVLSWDGLENHRKSLFKKTWFPDGNIWPLDSEKPFFRVLMAEARSKLPPKAPPPPPQPCRGGAWGNPDGCVSHEGLPIGEDGKCFWGREPSALETALSKLANGEEPLSDHDLKAVLQELEINDNEPVEMSPHCPHCKTDKARPYPGFQGWADCTGCGTSWRLNKRGSRGKDRETLLQERQIQDLSNVRHQIRECKWALAEAQVDDDFATMGKVRARLRDFANLATILESAATAA